MGRRTDYENKVAVGYEHNSWLDEIVMSVKLLLEVNKVLLFDVDIRIRLLVKVNISDSWCC